MASTYPIELRDKVLSAYDRGVGGSVKLAKLFDVSRSWICKLLKQRRETGSIAPKEYRHGPKPKLSDSQRDRLILLAGEKPDMTLKELRHRLRLKVSVSTVWRELNEAGFTFKRSPSKLANNCERTCNESESAGVAS